MWREKHQDYLFGAGAAIKPEFYGIGLSDYMIHSTEQIAKKIGLTVCKLAVIPANGRVINTYMRHGYLITEYFTVQVGEGYPDRFRCIMKKNLQVSPQKKILLDCCEVSCMDEAKLAEIITQGYVGVRFIKISENNLSENKIIFEKQGYINV